MGDGEEDEENEDKNGRYSTPTSFVFNETVRCTVTYRSHVWHFMFLRLLVMSPYWLPKVNENNKKCLTTLLLKGASPLWIYKANLYLAYHGKPYQSYIIVRTPGKTSKPKDWNESYLPHEAI